MEFREEEEGQTESTFSFSFSLLESGFSTQFRREIFLSKKEKEIVVVFDICVCVCTHASFTPPHNFN